MKTRLLHILLILPGLAAGPAAAGQPAAVDSAARYGHPAVKTVRLPLGQGYVLFRLRQYGERRDRVFINLHADEVSSVAAARQLLQERGGVMIQLENQRQRRLYFRLGRHRYAIDPNRIFTRPGIVQTLVQQGRYSEAAADEVQRLARRILRLVPAEASCIIALHNNREGYYSIESYQAGREKTRDARRVYLDPGQAGDDLFLTTDDTLYEAMANLRYNTVLQDNARCRDDGSLSVYFGRRGRRYVNCETLRGKTGQYLAMIRSLYDILDDLDRRKGGAESGSPHTAP
ncbi:MAG TPA: hypothetical protein VG870_01640 [Chitinophagaceae bacterium]|nr:hypothetical protein [Chitinophagaceae bacterium]